jgi:putative tryptophan/tyrosine transport system substrate-binding protein
MNTRIHLVALGAMLVALSFPAAAQQSAKVHRIGYLSTASPSPPPSAFRQGLRELGYVEGKNIISEYLKAEENFTGTPARAAELVRLKVEVIVTGGATNTRAAKEATTTIPIVFLQDPDPIGNGFVTSLARPGGNINGLSSMTADLSGK